MNDEWESPKTETKFTTDDDQSSSGRKYQEKNKFNNFIIELASLMIFL